MNVFSFSRGFTLIEMLLAIVIMGLAVSIVSVSVGQSVNNQERMQHLLDNYQAALTAKSLVIDRLKQGETDGEEALGRVKVSWVAEQIERRKEASIFIFELNRFTNPSSVISLYKVDVTIETPFTRRVFEFTQTIEQRVGVLEASSLK